jgi:SWI/SNF-related matrix-associated actin-dependent regulator of chromatin subfamily A-like protein 1
MRRRYRKQPPKKNIILTVVSDDILRAKTTKIASENLKAIKKACHVDDKRKTFDLARVDLRTLQTFSNKCTIQDIPPYVTRLFQKRPVDKFDQSKIPEKLWSTLFPYQKEGIKNIINLYGSRCLLADDMGLGKTRQALAFIGHCQPARVLVVCPSYLRYHWKHALHEWIGLDSQLVKKGNEHLEEDVCVVSYDMLHALGIPAGIFDVVVCDESHYVKSRKTKRTKAITPLVRSAKRALLITGTPALNRPIELFSQLYMLRPAYIKNYTSYAARYCNGKPTPFGYDDRGSSNSWELNWVLKKGFMVRRLKRDVLTQLPAKTRHTIWLEVKGKDLKDIERGFHEWKRLNSTIYKLPSGSEKQRLEIFERQKVISELFNATSVAKCQAIVDWIMDALDEGRSFIFFAYHRVVLDAVEEAVAAKNIEYMRIDGSTSAEKRQANVEAFQANDSIRIAILSIMAAGTGVTLTRVSECVFGELYWVPGVMIQAEDRVHRISQTAKVNIKYLLGTNTLDTYVHPNLCKKLATLDTLVDNRSDRTFEGKTTTTVAARDNEESLLSVISKLF